MSVAETIEYANMDEWNGKIEQRTKCVSGSISAAMLNKMRENTI